MEKTFIDITSCILSTTVAELATLYVCTLKTKYQNSEISSIRQVMKELRINSISIYKLSRVAVFSQILSTSSKYTLYRFFEREGQKNKIINGVAAGVITSLLIHPFDFYRIHYQMGASIKGNPYRGYSMSFCKTVASSSLFMPLYDFILNKTSSPFLSGIFSSLISTTLVHPLDFMKVRGIYGLKSDINFKNCYKGLSLNLLRVVPHFTITMCLIEEFTVVLNSIK